MRGAALIGTVGALLGALCGVAGAEERERKLDTKYIFGFTEGSGIDAVGEGEVSFEKVAGIGKRDGRYFGSESRVGYEFTPSRYVQFELGPLASTHAIANVSGLDDRQQWAFAGFFGEIRAPLIDRTAGQPLGIALSAEPKWRRIDEISGARVTNFGVEFKLDADLALIRDRLYLAGNLLYEPEMTRDGDAGAGWANESKVGLSTALAYRIAPPVFVAAEAWYLRHYEGAWLNGFDGDAVFVGPALYVRLSKDAFLTAAYNVQISGREIDEPGSGLNLSEFTRHRAKLKLAIEY